MLQMAKKRENNLYLDRKSGQKIGAKIAAAHLINIANKTFTQDDYDKNYKEENTFRFSEFLQLFMLTNTRSPPVPNIYLAWNSENITVHLLCTTTQHTTLVNPLFLLCVHSPHYTSMHLTQGFINLSPQV